MSDARRRRTRGSRKSPQTASTNQIRQTITEMYQARQIEWSLHLDYDRIDWAALLSLHLQMIELEGLETAIRELL
jgi:hypothetical protein